MPSLEMTEVGHSALALIVHLPNHFHACWTSPSQAALHCLEPIQSCYVCIGHAYSQIICNETSGLIVHAVLHSYENTHVRMLMTTLCRPDATTKVCSTLPY